MRIITFGSIITLCVLTLLPSNCGATTILFGESNGHRYLAADGVMGFERYGVPTGTTLPACKIIFADRFIIAHAGTATFRDFRPETLASGIAAHDLDLAGFTNQLATNLEAVLKVMLQEYAATGSRALPQGLDGIVVDSNTLKAIRLLITIGHNGAVTRKVDPVDPLSDPQRHQEGVWLPMGIYSAFGDWINGYWRLHPAGIDADPVLFIRGFLENQSLKAPGKVGPPFSILLLNPGNPQWIERGACLAGVYPTANSKSFLGSGAPAFGCTTGDNYTDTTNKRRYLCDAANAWKQVAP